MGRIEPGMIDALALPFRDGPAALCSLPATRRELIEAGVVGSVSGYKQRSDDDN